MNIPISSIFYIPILLLINHLVYKYLFTPILTRFTYAARLITRGVRVKGRVVGHVDKEHSGDELQYAAIVEFTYKDGDTLRVTSDVYRLREPVINSPIDVYYDGNDPDWILIDEGGALFPRLLTLLILVGCWVAMNVLAVGSILAGKLLYFDL